MLTSLWTFSAWSLLALLAGSLVYCVLTIVAARRYRAVQPPPATIQPPISLLKPLFGAEDALLENLRSFFTQDYSPYEILFAVRHASDPALIAVRQLQQQYPQVPMRIVLTGEPPHPNAKVYSLDLMAQAAQHELLVMSDSDVRVDRAFLARLAAEFVDPSVDLITCPYRAVPGGGLPARLEAVMMNTEFLGGVLVARMLEGMRFALGPTIAMRRSALAKIGGFDRVKEYLAEDFVLGQFVAEQGSRVVLSSAVIEHHIGNATWRQSAIHRLRWCRSTRRSRPAGYFGQVFINPLPLALLLVMLAPASWPMLGLTIALRTAAAHATAEGILQDPLCRGQWYLVPLADIVSFCFWVAGFWGNTIVWRGHRYSVESDGRFRPVSRG